MVTFKAVVVPARYDLNGEPDLVIHQRVTRGVRNKPVYCEGVTNLDGSPKPAVNEDGSAKTTVEQFVHVYVQPEGQHAFHFECAAAEEANFPFGKEVTVTVE